MSNHEPLVQAFAAIRAELVKVGAAFGKAMSEFMVSPEGRYLKAVCDYYERHPEELDAMIAAREVEAARQGCHCLCPRWDDHRGRCAGWADTERPFGGLSVPMCGPCAAALDQRREALLA